MKFSRDWLTDFIDLSGLTDDELGRRFTAIGHAIESVETHGDDTIFDLEITTNRVDAMSHAGMARELGAALGKAPHPPSGHPSTPPRSARRRSGQALLPASGEKGGTIHISIDAPEMCGRYTATVIRGIAVKPSPARVQWRLEAVGLRPIN